MANVLYLALTFAAAALGVCALCAALFLLARLRR